MTLRIDGNSYEVAVPFDTRSDGMGGDMEFTSPTKTKVVNLCEKCHRFDVEPIVLRSVEELIAEGWIIPTEEHLPPTDVRYRDTPPDSTGSREA